jgi:hypothetical protein
MLLPPPSVRMTSLQRIQQSVLRIESDLSHSDSAGMIS